MLELTKHFGKGPVSMSEISKNQDIPVKYLEQLIIPLKKARLITSVRGPKGGHMLSKPPERIYLWEVLSLLETKMEIVDCVGNEKTCKHASECAVRPIWGMAYEAMMKIFVETSLSDVLELSENQKETSPSKGKVSRSANERGKSTG
jgi:Rrf2 family protein